jgi:hypothetical protein
MDSTSCHEPGSHDSETRRKRADTVWLAFLLGLAALSRLYGCWAFRHNLNLDAGVVALMARHVAQGSACPVFFYGQPHMGALEPWLSGLACRVFGISGFAVCLGTALVSWAILPVVYAWARDIAGPRAGRIALALLIMGPGGFFHYSVSPRGAYAAILLFGTAAMWYAARSAREQKAGHVQKGANLFLLGILAGLAWWSGPLTAPAILVAGLILLQGMRRSLFDGRLLLAGWIGFLIGSSPFWWYNMLNGWPSFGMTSSLGRVSPVSALGWFFLERFPSLMIRHDFPFALRAPAALFYVIGYATTIVMAISAWRRRNRTVAIPLTAAIAFVPALAAVFSVSHFAAVNTPRYLLPIVPVAAVMLGVAMEFWRPRLPRGTTLLPLALLVAMQLPTLKWAADFERGAAREQTRIETLAETLQQHDIRTVYAPIIRRAWNFALHESVVFSDLHENFYRPHFRQAETDDRIAVLDDYGDLNRFLDATGGKAERLKAAGHSVQTTWTPPERPWDVLHDEAILSITDANGADRLPDLTGRRIDRVWKTSGQNRPAHLDIVLRRPQRLSGLRVAMPGPNGVPGAWALQGWTKEDGWFELVESGPMPIYFWSGPRPYWGVPFFRVEARFKPTHIEKLRLLIHENPNVGAARIHHLSLMTPAAHQPPTSVFTIDQIVATLDARSITRLYADRWEALRVHEASAGRIWTPLSAAAFERDPATSAMVRLSPRTAFLVRTADADLTRQTLSERHIDIRETDLPPWTLIEADPGGPWANSGALDAGLVWSGFALFSDRALQAPELAAWAKARLETNATDTLAMDALRQALDGHPYLHDARRLLVRAYTARGDHEKALDQSTTLERHIQPAIPAPVRFGRPIEFLGYDIEPRSVAPGETVRIRYYWRHAEKSPERWAVFVHCIGAHGLFQDDHVFLENLPDTLRATPIAETILVERDIAVPLDMPSGVVEIRLGVYDRNSGKRLKPRTKLNTRKKAVNLPVTLTVRDEA